MALALLGGSAVHAEGFSFFRYDDDFTFLSDPTQKKTLVDDYKFLPLGTDAGQYVSLGADLRERIESYDEGYFGLADARQTTYLLSRALVDADLHWDEIRAFVQLGNYVEARRKPGAIPTDDDRGDVQQGFFDYAPQLDSGKLTLRAGRFEMKFGEGLIVSPRDGPNIRQAWDGAWVFYEVPGFRVDVLAVRPVTDKPGYFDDVSNQQQALWGVYATLAPKAFGGYGADVYYFGNTNHVVALYTGPVGGPGIERTATVGGRWYGHLGAFDSTNEAAFQSGHYDTRDVRAFAIHTEMGWTFHDRLWNPRFGLKADVLSGSSHPASGTIGTFNALYPNFSYATDAVLEAPANLLQAGADLHFYPTQSVDFGYTAASLWRYSTRDAFYASPLFPLISGSSSDERYTGFEQQLATNWRINPNLSLRASVVHFSAGSYVSSAHGRDTNFALFYLAARL